MSEDRAAKVRASVFVLAGVLWVSLTGLCTWNYAQGPAGGWEKLWPIGLWITSAGMAPLTLGLQTLVPGRMLGSALILLGAAWMAYGVSWLIPALKEPGVFENAENLSFLAVLWLVFQAPGALMVIAGVGIFRSRGSSR
jgi:hypothetical protein